MTASSRLTFTYWSDPLCIWAFVAEDKLARILHEWGPRVEVRHRVVPVFGSVSWRFTKGPWAAAGPQGRVEATARIAREHGFSTVDGRVWVEDPPASSWSPGAAIKAAFMAEHAGEIQTGTAAAFQWAMREAFFLTNRNIARRPVQLEVAESLHIDRHSLERRLDDGTAYAALWEDDNDRLETRVQGSPTYVFDAGRAMLYGNFPFGVLHATVQELAHGLGLGGSAC